MQFLVHENLYPNIDEIKCKNHKTFEVERKNIALQFKPENVKNSGNLVIYTLKTLSMYCYNLSFGEVQISLQIVF